MRLLRMTTGRWMILVAAVSFAFGLLTCLRRVAAGKVASFMQKIRDQAVSDAAGRGRPVRRSVSGPFGRAR